MPIMARQRAEKQQQQGQIVDLTGKTGQSASSSLFASVTTDMQGQKAVQVYDVKNLKNDDFLGKSGIKQLIGRSVTQKGEIIHVKLADSVESLLIGGTLRVGVKVWGVGVWCSDGKAPAWTARGTADRSRWTIQIVTT
jgi:hypothetical protein